MKVTQLPSDPGPAAWNSILPPQDYPKTLSENQTADWLIIGAGYAGLSAAQRLLELHPKDKVVILEATRVAHGPAGRNSGFMIDLPHNLSSDQYTGSLQSDQMETISNRHGIDFAEEMANTYGFTPEAFNKSGKINAAATAKGSTHNHNYAKHLLALNEPHEMLDAAQMLALTGTDYYQNGLFTAGTAIIQPALYVRSLASSLANNGILIFENSPVTTLTRSKTWIAKTPTGTISAPNVILAVNGHLNSFGYAKGRLMHVFTYASMTEPLTADQQKRLGGIDTWGLTSADPMGSTVRRISGVGGHRLVIRNRFTYDPSITVNDARVAKMGHSHDHAFSARFPMLSDVKMQYRWAGRLCLTKNNVNAAGQLDDGLYSACCQNGLGTAKGVFLGKTIAEYASGNTSPLIDYAIGQDKPKKLPPNLITKIGANTVIRWNEISAGREL